MSAEKRPYRKRQRAQQEAETRLRITESAMELHGTLGPARTSVAAVAEHAGVRRSTVYRHFPDEAALFGACSAHWSEQNPPPDVAAWAAIADPEERLRTALGELYAYYRRTGAMLDNLLRDAPAVPLIPKLMAPFAELLEAMADALMRGRSRRGRARTRVRAAVGHAIGFSTWQELTGAQGLDDAEAVDLMVRFVDGI